MRRKIAILAILTMIMALFTVPASAELDLPDPVWTSETSTYPLYAGQSMLVGDVLIKQDSNGIWVKFELNEDAMSEGWLIMETHVDVKGDVADIPQKNGNPIPGQFEQKETLDPGMPEAGWYFFEFDMAWEMPLAVAAHAVVERQECVLMAAAPYGPSSVYETLQGSQLNKAPIKEARSNPEAALEFEGTKLETDFYSLGFIHEGDDTYKDGDEAFITVKFDKSVLNGPGNDIQIIEDTWGLPYPVESCDVSASADGIEWVMLGSANNQHPMTDGVHTVTEFDLGELESAMYIKLVDTTKPELFSGRGAADGFDVNAVIALHDHVVCTVYSETAWGGIITEDGLYDFNGKNWARYINYSPTLPNGLDGLE